MEVLYDVKFFHLLTDQLLTEHVPEKSITLETEMKKKKQTQTLCPQGDDILIWEIQHNRQLKEKTWYARSCKCYGKKIKQREI